MFRLLIFEDVGAGGRNEETYGNKTVSEQKAATASRSLVEVTHRINMGPQLRKF
ncbi:MAG: hypothetical protein JW947_09980 [Sedimentisphaerales bacterium]|nr:hypothetical protein [Sedimentisphaerales bacterium]